MTLQEELLLASDCFSSPFMSSSPMRLGHVLTAQAFDYMAVTSTFQSTLLKAVMLQIYVKAD